LLSFANDASDYAVLLADLEILRFESDLLSAKTMVAGGAACNARQKASPHAGAIAHRRRTDELAKVAPIEACYYLPV
jgi:hypothetical protein